MSRPHALTNAPHHTRRGHQVDASLMKRCAPQQAACGKKSPEQNAMRTQRLGRVVRTRRVVAAATGRSKHRRNRRRQHALINPDERKQRLRRQSKQHPNNRSCHCERSKKSSPAPLRGELWSLRCAQDDSIVRKCFHDLLGKSLRHASTNFCSISRYSSRLSAARATISKSQSGGTRF